MKIYGYKDESFEASEIQPDELAEITLIASPEELRKIARFMLSAAEKMELNGRKYEHEHLSDIFHEFENSPHLVIFNVNV